MPVLENFGRPPSLGAIGIRNAQDTLAEIYKHTNAARTDDQTFVRFTEEVGELARALRRAAVDRPNLQEELADCLAWLLTIASRKGIDMQHAFFMKFGMGCPRCQHEICRCPEIS